MGVRVARGLFRLWVVFSVLWIAGVGAVTWQSFPVNNVTVVGANRELSDQEVGLGKREFTDEEMGIVHGPKTTTLGAPERKPPLDPSKSYTVIPPEKSSAVNPDPSSNDFVLPSDAALDQERHAALQLAALLALVPPFLVLALGSALRWALLGFRT